MTIHRCAFLLLTAVPLCLWGCGSPTANAPVSENPEELVAQWIAVTSVEQGEPDFAKASEIVGRLVAQGADKLLPLLEVLGRKEVDPRQKLMVVMTMQPYVSQSHEARLVELTGTQFETYTRADAAHLLGILQQRRQGSPQGMARIKELMVDPERPVRSAAILVMELAGDPDGLAKAVELWPSAEATPMERTSIVLNMPQQAVLQNTKIFAEAILDTQLTGEARKRAIQDLGMVGDASVLEALKKCAETETDPVIRDMAKAAAEAVDARVQQGLVAVTVDSKDLPPPPPGAVSAAPSAAPVEPPAAPAAAPTEPTPAPAAAAPAGS